jgi:hypothetical protein
MVPDDEEGKAAADDVDEGPKARATAEVGGVDDAHDEDIERDGYGSHEVDGDFKPPPDDDENNGEVFFHAGKPPLLFA